MDKKYLQGYEDLTDTESEDELVDKNGEMTMEAKRLQIVDIANEILERIENNPSFDSEDLHFVVENIGILKNIADTMIDKRFYVEVGDNYNKTGYFLQSKWFETLEEAREFAKQFEFIETGCFVRIMSSEFNFDEPTDIEIYEYIKE